jgi:cytosine/adenosine deaminase-related metal-dependent hydrolase
MTLYLKDATYIDWRNLTFTRSHLAVTKGPGGAVRFLEEIPAEGQRAAEDRMLDCRNRLVTHAFACGHHHIYSALARGMPAPKKSPGNFVEILEYVWWTLDKCLDLDMVRASALATALYCVKNGVTFVIDHHASPFAVEGSLETIARALDEVGLSHLLCYEITDRDGEEIREKGLAETEAFLTSCGQGHVGLHASFTVGPTLLEAAVDLARRCNTGIHVHVAEDRADQEACLEKYGQRVVERFGEAGVLALPATLLSHCIHLEEKERGLLRKSLAWVAQNVESNQNNNVGLADYSVLGGRVILGTDGMHSDMLRSAKAVFLAGRAVEGLDMAGAYARLRNVHHYIRHCGFAGDGDNNLVILDYDAPTEVTADNFLGHFIYGLDSRHVESVISSGRLIVENRKVTTVNETEVLQFAREMGKKLWAKMAS